MRGEGGGAAGDKRLLVNETFSGGEGRGGGGGGGGGGVGTCPLVVVCSVHTY